jgi:hypothetical protein
VEGVAIAVRIGAVVRRSNSPWGLCGDVRTLDLSREGFGPGERGSFRGWDWELRRKAVRETEERYEPWPSRAGRGPDSSQGGVQRVAPGTQKSQ